MPDIFSTSTSKICEIKLRPLVTPKDIRWVLSAIFKTWKLDFVDKFENSMFMKRPPVEVEKGTFFSAEKNFQMTYLAPSTLKSPGRWLSFFLTLVIQTSDTFSLDTYWCLVFDTNLPKTSFSVISLVLFTVATFCSPLVCVSLYIPKFGVFCQSNK